MARHIDMGVENVQEREQIFDDDQVIIVNDGDDIPYMIRKSLEELIKNEDYK